MDKKKSILNIGVSIFFKILLLVFMLITRRIFIKYLGNDLNGLNSLYLSIIGVVSVAELGIGTSIVFCMYKPIVENDTEKVSALYNLYKKLYCVIACVVFIIGMCIMPFLQTLAKGLVFEKKSLYLSFFLMLVSTVLTYMFSSKISLINAHKNNYVTTTINSLGQILQCVLQIVVIVTTNSFSLYLLCRIISTLAQWLVTNLYVEKKHKNLIHTKFECDNFLKKEVKKKAAAMFGHKLGGVLVNSADSIIISFFIGVTALGKYSNYVLIIKSLESILVLFFTPLTSIIGHLYVKNKKETQKDYNFLYTINYCLGIIFFLGYYAVIDDVIYMFFGSGLDLPKSISFVIALNYFIQFLRRSGLVFKDATGTFYNDRFKPFIEGGFNIILSIIFVLILPENFRVVGVILATIITNLLICDIIEPYVLYKYGFGESPQKFYQKNYTNIVIFIFMLIFFNLIKMNFTNHIISFFVNGVSSVFISLGYCLFIFLTDKEFKSKILLLKKIPKKIKKT